MGVGKFTEFFQGIKENFSQRIQEGKLNRTLKKSESKANLISTSVLKSTNGTTSANGARKSVFVQLNTSALKTRIASVKNVVLAKFQSMPKREPLQKEQSGLPDEVHAHLSNDGTLERQTLLRDFKDTVLCLADYKNKGPCLQASVQFLAKANKEGKLDQSLYNGVARLLQASLSNPRQSLSLDDDWDLPPVQNGVTSELMGMSSLKGELRTKLEGFTFVNDIQNLKSELKPTADIDKKTGEHIIDKVLEAYPTHTEVTVELNGKSYTALLVPNEKNKPEILIKQEKLGEGAAAIAYKAQSLTSKEAVVVKYATSLAEQSNEEENAVGLLKNHGGKEGIQKSMQLVTLQSAEGAKKVVVSPFYKNCDYGKALIMEQFLVEVLHIPPSEIHFETAEMGAELKAKAKEKLQDMNERLVAFFSGSASREEKLMELDNFSNKYTGVLTAIFESSEPVKQLISAYRTLINS